MPGQLNLESGIKASVIPTHLHQPSQNLQGGVLWDVPPFFPFFSFFFIIQGVEYAMAGA